MKINNCSCTDRSVHALDGLALDSFTDAATAESVMMAYINTLNSHPSFSERSTEHVFCVLLDNKDVVDTMNIQVRKVDKDLPELQRWVRFDHPKAEDGQHTIIFVAIRYGKEGKLFSRATGFVPPRKLSPPLRGGELNFIP